MRAVLKRESMVRAAQGSCKHMAELAGADKPLDKTLKGECWGVCLVSNLSSLLPLWLSQSPSYSSFMRPCVAL